MKKYKDRIVGIPYPLCIICLGLTIVINAKGDEQNSARLFQAISNADWKEVFHDPCTGNWQEYWMLDGLKAKVETSKEGMDFAAGSTFGDDSCHAVLWTKRSFNGDVRIDYEYTKLDETIRAVTILYILATGDGEDPYKKDIAEWSHLRNVPSMRTYYDNMNTYHISYAAFELENTDPARDYIRARRYMPLKKKALNGTELEPDYFETGLFEIGVPYRLTIIKKGNDLFMHISNNEKKLLCHWNTDTLPPIDEGRIGLRHMYTRSARYRDFRVSVPKDHGNEPVEPLSPPHSE